MTLPELHGVVPILLTPFDAHGRIDAESLRNLVDFTIDAGVHGLGIALGSEVYKLTEAEREIVIKTVCQSSSIRARPLPISPFTTRTRARRGAPAR